MRMQRILNVLFFPIIFLVSSMLVAQDYSFDFNSLTIKDGLSQSEVYCIVQDKKGYMWMGTQDGLNLYNGYDFKVFRNDLRNPHSIADKGIQCLYVDKQGIVWIGTSSGGLNRFDHSTFSFSSYTIDTLNPKSISDNSIRTIFEAKNGEFWIGTSHGGLNKFDRRKEAFEVFKHNPFDTNSISNSSIKAIAEDSFGKLWVGTVKGLNILDPNKGSFIRFHNKSDYNNTLSTTSINDLLFDAQSNLWVATLQGLFKIDKTGGNLKLYKNNLHDANSLSNNNAVCLFQDQFDRIWVGTEDGLNLYNPLDDNFTVYKKNVRKAASLNSNYIFDITEDRSGTIWLGTQGGGVSWFESQPKRFITYRNVLNDPYSLRSDNVRCFFEEPESGNIWVGTLSGGLILFNRKNNQFVDYKNNPRDANSICNNRVNTIYKDRFGVLWIGTSNGLDIFDYSTSRFIHYNQNISNKWVNIIYEDSKGQLLFGTEGGGLNILDRSKNQFIVYQKSEQSSRSISDNRVRSIYEDSKGVYLIGTIDGLNIFNPKTKEFTRFYSNKGDDSCLSSNVILSIYEDNANRLWLNTVNGVNLINSTTNRFTCFTTEDGLPNNTVYGMVEDNQGYLWLTTNYGLSKFDPDKKTFKNYDISHGLQGNEFNYNAFLKCRNGEIIVGGINGITVFNPNKIFDNTYKPPLVFTDLKIVNKSVPIGKAINGRVILKKTLDNTDTIELTHRDYTISIEFAALHFVSPQYNKYAYMLKGLDSTWNEVGNRRVANYSTLPQGKYTFLLKACNNDGVWNDEVKSFEIIVHPRFYETWWFQLLTIISLTIFLYIFYQYRVYAIKEQKRILENTVHERTLELSESNTQLEEHQAELEIRQEEITAQAELLARTNLELEKLSIVASKTDNAISIMDPSTNFEWVNEGFSRMYRCTMDELIEQKGKNLLSVSQREDIVTIIQDCISNKRAVNYQTFNSLRAGEPFWSQTTLTPILNQEGEIVKLIAIETDITKLKEAEFKITKQKEELEKHRNNLERTVKERTAELEIAKNLAEESERLKSAFLANMSHEIRTPMNAIIGFSNLLTHKGIDESEKEEMIESIQSNCNTLLQLIDNIIDLSKFEAGQLNLSIKPFNLNSLLKEIYETYIQKIRREGITSIDLKIRLGLNDPNFIIQTDFIRIKQIINNLIDNAFKFTENGSIEFGYTLTNSDKIEFYVKDTGIGMTVEQQGLIFNRFTKIEEDKTKLYRGAGLGLTICKSIANLMGGDIFVESEIGKGTTVYLSVPLVKGSLTPSSPTVSEFDFTLLNWAGKSIIIAEDEESNFIYLEKLLMRTNLKLIHAHNGVEVIEYFKTFKPDLILMDIKMPKMDGIEAAREIRMINPTIPIIALSALAFNHEVDDIKKQGFNDYLTKPINPLKLIKVMEAIFKG